MDKFTTVLVVGVLSVAGLIVYSRVKEARDTKETLTIVEVTNHHARAITKLAKDGKLKSGGFLGGQFNEETRTLLRDAIMEGVEYLPEDYRGVYVAWRMAWIEDSNSDTTKFLKVDLKVLDRKYGIVEKPIDVAAK